MKSMLVGFYAAFFGKLKNGKLNGSTTITTNLHSVCKKWHNFGINPSSSGSGQAIFKKSEGKNIL